MSKTRIHNIACIFVGCLGLWDMYGFIRTAPEWAPMMVNGLLMLSVGIMAYRRPKPPQVYEYFIAYELNGPEYRSKGRCSLLRSASIFCMKDIEGIEEYLQPRHPQGLLLIRSWALLGQRDKAPTPSGA